MGGVVTNCLIMLFDNYSVDDVDKMAKKIDSEITYMDIL